MSQSLEQLKIDRLSIADRLELIGQNWDSIDTGEGPIPIPRLALARVGATMRLRRRRPGAAVPWEVAKARLADRP